MHRRAIPLVAFAAALAVGCGDDEGESTPAACLAGPQGYLEALKSAPEEASLDGTPLADCLVEEQSAGAITRVGRGMIGAARRLNEQAQQKPLGEAPLRLGYLVGAVEERAAHTGGIHQDLALNVESAATFIPPDEVLPGGFQQRYEEGLAAGRASIE